MNNQTKQNIVLIGFMGAGKTTIGKKLADKLNYQFLDTDSMIEDNAGISINEIFEIHGEEYFRDLETKLLKDLSGELSGAILSTGGGMPVREENIMLLREIGHVIYIKLSRKTMIERLKDDNKRPLLQGYDLVERVDYLLNTREKYYKRVANDIVISDNKSKDEIIELITLL